MPSPTCDRDRSSTGHLVGHRRLCHGGLLGRRRRFAFARQQAIRLGRRRHEVKPPRDPETPAVSTAPSGLAPSAAAPIPNGDYLSGYIPKDTAKAMLSDPAIANDPLVTQFLNQYTAPTRTRLHLADGNFTQAVEQEAGSLGIGDEGTDAFVDDHTIVLQSTHVPGSYKFGFTLAGDQLTWKVQAGPNGAADLATVRVIFEAMPFIRQH